VGSDARLLRRILQNLISNALRYTERGEVRITAEQKGNRVLVDVCDTGPGIARKHRAIIFREFSRLEGGRRVNGAGLGLAIVERAVRMLRHRLTLTSRLGVGSTFRLALPAAKPLRPSAPPRRKAPSNPLKGRRILIVENEPGSLNALVALLEGWGCHVDAAQNEAQAIVHCRTTGYAPDLIVADYHLDDGLTGETLIATIRARLGQPIPAMIVTADRDDQLRSRLTSLGLSVLTKPVKPERLRTLIQSLTRAS
jgi:CheY-like chemotaxis protein